MRLLVLGGTRFVGRAAVEAACGRGWSVTIFHRGQTGTAPDGVESLLGDRAAGEGLTALAGRRWDAVIDTWDGAPAAVLATARLLHGAVGQYVYVSSRSVYRPPLAYGLTEDAPVFDTAPDATDGSYGELKAGGERATRTVFGADALVARAGLVLGPHETVGRLVWWLRRLARGGDVLAPGPADLPLQYVDVRDLAQWLLDMTAVHTSGTFNAVSRTGHATMAELLRAGCAATGSPARLRWADPSLVLAFGLRPWTDLPIWVPFGHSLRALHETDAARAAHAGLRCRPVAETVADTWAWLQQHSQLAAQSGVGLDPRTEQAILARL